jgi:hypothetical protein
VAHSDASDAAGPAGDGRQLAGWDDEVSVPDELGFVGQKRQVRGQAVGAELVAAEAVPGDYPVEIDSSEALAIQFRVDRPPADGSADTDADAASTDSSATVDTTDDDGSDPDGSTSVPADPAPIVAYFSWPAGTDDRLSGLLELQGLDELAGLHGETALLALKEDYYLPAVPATPRGDGRALYAIYAGLVPHIVVALAGIFATGFNTLADSTAFLGVWAAATVLVLPVATYLDAAYLTTTTTWTGRPVVWAVAAAVPGLNLAALSLYLLRRRGVEPIVE